MALNNYMRQGNNGSINISIDNLPNCGFIDANKVNEIAKARVLSGSERANITPGSPDVLIISGTGERKYITRKELASSYTHCNGKKIVLAFLRNNTNYMVSRNCSDKYKIMKLPDNCTGTFKGKNVQPGSYIVCKQNNQGEIDLSTLSIVSPKLFRKMFKIPMQSIIKKHIDGKGNRNISLFNIQNKIRQNTPNKAMNSSPISPMPSAGITNRVQPSIAANKPAMGNGMNNNNNSSVNKHGINTTFKRPQIDTSKLGINPGSINIPTKEERSKYKYKVINQIMSMQNTNQLIGYTIMDLSTGKTAPIEVAKLSKLCEEKLVENVKLVQLENGTRYLQGNGIVLKNLSKVLA